MPFLNRKSSRGLEKRCDCIFAHLFHGDFERWPDVVEFLLGIPVCVGACLNSVPFVLNLLYIYPINFVTCIINCL